MQLELGMIQQTQFEAKVAMIKEWTTLSVWLAGEVVPLLSAIPEVTIRWVGVPNGVNGPKGN
jgi:hypothetical protein